MPESRSPGGKPARGTTEPDKTTLVSLNLENTLSRIDDYRRRVTMAMLDQPKWNQEALAEYVKNEAIRLGKWFLEQGIVLEGFPTFAEEAIKNG